MHLDSTLHLIPPHQQLCFSQPLQSQPFYGQAAYANTMICQTSMPSSHNLVTLSHSLLPCLTPGMLPSNLEIWVIILNARLTHTITHHTSKAQMVTEHNT